MFIFINLWLKASTIEDALSREEKADVEVYAKSWFQIPDQGRFTEFPAFVKKAVESENTFLFHMWRSGRDGIIFGGALSFIRSQFWGWEGVTYLEPFFKLSRWCLCQNQAKPIHQENKLGEFFPFLEWSRKQDRTQSQPDDYFVGLLGGVFAAVFVSLSFETVGWVCSWPSIRYRLFLSEEQKRNVLLGYIAQLKEGQK
ncbi:MAG: hypothetical protein H6850_01095 [Alphaproteobacteria bacterium]|nr:MAG: hypothetical protein H6850_01095 [Alphaproteobacteria bacterium]